MLNIFNRICMRLRNIYMVTDMINMHSEEGKKKLYCSMKIVAVATTEVLQSAKIIT